MKATDMRTPLGRVRGLGSAKAGTDHFWRQRVTALANTVLGIAGIAIVISLAGRDYLSAKQLLSSPLVDAVLLLLIVSAAVHMRIGMQVVIEDYVHEDKTKFLAVILNTFFAVAIVAVAAIAIFKLSTGA